jgi:hypothetical protein
MPEPLCYERYIFGISIAKDGWARLPEGSDWTILFLSLVHTAALKLGGTQ